MNLVHWIGRLLDEKLHVYLSTEDRKYGGAWFYLNLTHWSFKILSVNLTIPRLIYTDNETGEEIFAKWALDMGTHIGPLALDISFWEPGAAD